MLQLGTVEKALVGGEKIDAHGRRLLESQIFWFRRNGFCRDHEKLGMAPVAREANVASASPHFRIDAILWTLYYNSRKIASRCSGKSGTRYLPLHVFSHRSD